MLELIEAVRGRSTGIVSELHGEHHWQCVAHAGRELATLVPGADAEVVFLFALFHDSMRENDGRDPEHGPRGSLLARELLPELPQLELLCAACDEHTNGGISADPTIGTCWDADRLNLWRVRKEPDPMLLSTEPARDPTRILAARDLLARRFTWEELSAP